jgi:hypothetical protein
MKKQAHTIIALLVLVGSMAVVARAQGGRTRSVASIPFQFHVAGRTLPAGEYTISQINPTAYPGALNIRSKDGSTGALVQMNAAIGKLQKSGKLIFRRYANEYFLAEAWLAGEAYGMQAPKSRAERFAQREMAGIKPKAETIAVKSR